MQLKWKLNQIMNYNLRAQYNAFLKLLSYQSLDRFTYFAEEKDKKSKGEVLLSFIYYLLVQDRIKDAIIFYKQFESKYGDNANNINVDYLKCYLLLFDDEEEKEDENVKTILQIADSYLSSSSKSASSRYPKEKLMLFYAVNQLLTQDKAEQKQEPRNQSNRCRLRLTKLVKQCNVILNGMNTELLFSINPFTFTDNKNDD